MAPANLKGLSEADIKELLGSPELTKARELIIELDPRFELIDITPEIEKGDKAVEDYLKRMQKLTNVNTLLGKDLMVALRPQLGGLLDFSAEFTKANLESAGINGGAVRDVGHDVESGMAVGVRRGADPGHAGEGPGAASAPHVAPVAREVGRGQGHGEGGTVLVELDRQHGQGGRQGIP